MSRTNPIAAVVYGGERYPITNDIGESIIQFIRKIDLLAKCDFYEFPTTDGRQVILNLGQSLPIAFEVDIAGE